MGVIYIREYKPQQQQQQRESSMRGNAARRGSHNVTHRYRERANRSVRTLAVALARECNRFPRFIIPRSRASPFPTSVRCVARPHRRR
jgi:hypothetical protein